MKVLVIGAKPVSLTKFRGELLQKMLDDGHEVVAMADDSDPQTAETLMQRGIRFQSYDVQRAGLNPVSDLRTCMQLYRAMQSLKPDVIMSYTVKPVVWGGLAARWYGKATFFPLITGLGYAFNRGSFLKSILRRVVVFLYKRALSGARNVIFQNQDNLNLFVQENIVDAAKCKLVGGSGVNLVEYSPTPLPDRPPVVFLCIARLLIDKGISEYAEAAKRVREKYPGTRCLLVGEPDPSPNRIDPMLVQQWHDAGDIEYLGGKADVRPSLDSCHVYVLPSYHEGLPRTVLEAMAKGRPVVTSDAAGCRDTVEPFKNGLLVQPGDADSLTEALIWCVENEAEWERLGDRSLQLAKERFDVVKINRDLTEIMGL